MRFPNGLLAGLLACLPLAWSAAAPPSSGASALRWVRVPFQLITGLSGRD